MAPINPMLADTAESLLAEVAGSRSLDDIIPKLSRDESMLRRIESVVQRLPTAHELVHGDARAASDLPDESVHLVVTSPPYWTPKRYNDGGCIVSEESVWNLCHDALVPRSRVKANEPANGYCRRGVFK